MNENTELNISGYYQTQLSSLILPDNYKKLIKRIIGLNGSNDSSGNVFKVETVEDILKLEPYYFSQLPSIGKLYIKSLISFKKELPYFLKNVEPEQEFKESVPQIILSEEQLKIPLNTIALPIQYNRLVKRISTMLEAIPTVEYIITIDVNKFSKTPSIGKQYIISLIDLQKQLPILLENKKKSSLLFNDNYLIELSKIDNILIEDIENYLWTLDEMKIDIALSRWGFNQGHETLQEVGDRFSVTKERIRQLEKIINTNLSLNFRIQPKVLWANVREKMTEDLTIFLPNLAKCFKSDKLLYSFLELCCQVKSGSIKKIVFTKINIRIINQFFCIYQSPIEQESIINELVSNYGYSKSAAICGIKQLGNQNKLKITELGIYPKKLIREEAIAHILTFHPTGLPWKDISRIVNKKKCSSTKMDETRATHGFNDSEYVYLCAKGTYRNLIFLDFEQFDLPKIMQHLLDYFKQNKINSLNLHDYYHQTNNQYAKIEYFTLRHLVREYGEEYELFFNGKSNVDGVSLDPSLKRVTQADVVIKALNESKVAMTMQEIAECLRSKSKGHATFYIHNLMEEGKVVRVDKMVYTTTEKAFKNIDAEAIMQIIEEIMNTSDEIVEGDVFREYINMELNLSYSKYIYIALVKIKIDELGWYKNANFFSRTPIPYKNLLDLCRQFCDPTLPSRENAKKIQGKAWLTDIVASNAVQQWRWVLKNN